MTVGIQSPSGDDLSAREQLGISVEEAAARLSVSRAHAYRLVSDKTIPSIRLWKRIIVPLSGLARMLDRQASRHDAPPDGPPGAKRASARVAQGDA